MKRRLIIDDEENEKFTRSECICGFCKEMNEEADNFYSNVPSTNLQKRMLDIIKKIEDREKAKEKK